MITVIRKMITMMSAKGGSAFGGKKQITVIKEMIPVINYHDHRNHKLNHRNHLKINAINITKK